MSAKTFPASPPSPIKSIQRGVASTSGNVTISSVDISKCTVRSFSTGSSGEVAGTGAIGDIGLAGSVSTHSGPTSSGGGPAWGQGIAAYSNVSSQTVSGDTVAASISSGTTDLTVKEFGAYLQDSTTLVVTGACRWEVIEFN